LGGYISQAVASYEGIEGVAFNAPGPVGQLAWVKRPRFEVHLDAHDPLAYVTFPGYNYSVSTWARWAPKGVSSRHIASPKWYTDSNYGGCHGCCGPYYGSPDFCRNNALKAMDLFCAHKHNSALRSPGNSTASINENEKMSVPSPIQITGSALAVLAGKETIDSFTRSMQGLPPTGFSEGSLIQVEPGKLDAAEGPNASARVGESKQNQTETRDWSGCTATDWFTRSMQGCVPLHEPAPYWLLVVIGLASIVAVGACLCCCCVFCIRRMS